MGHLGFLSCLLVFGFCLFWINAVSINKNVVEALDGTE
nr:MAG TPA: hypothetical protein [Caudoviricetes sp.]